MPYVRALVEENKKKTKSKYLFVAFYSGKHNMISISWGNDFCRRILSPIVGRRINPHLFKATAITNKLEEGFSMEIVSRKLGNHESVQTTSVYDLRDNDDEAEGLW